MYVTFRGESATPVNNIQAFDASGGMLNPGVLQGLPPSVILDELRSMWHDTATDRLYVDVSHKSQSGIYMFGTENPHFGRKFLEIFANRSATDVGLVHPYKFVMAPGIGKSFVSCQGSEEVLGLDLHGAVLPVASYLEKHFPTASFDPGAFVGPSTLVPADQGGLQAPRGMAVSRNGSVLYVSDNAGGTVRSYDTSTGQFLGDVFSSQTAAPVALLLVNDGATLLVSLEVDNTVVHIDLGSGTSTVIASGFDHPAGLAIDCSNNIYVADRKGQQIWTFPLRSSEGTTSVFISALEDMPEQLLVPSCM